MKIPNKKTNRKPLIITLSAIAAILLFGGVAYATFGGVNNKTEDNTTSTQTKSSKKSTSSTSEDTATPTSTDKKTETNTDPQAPTTTDESTGKTVVSMVTSSNISNSTVYIRGGVNNVVDANGSCYASLTGPNGENIKKETTLLQNASTTDCKTIEIPTTDLAKGTWTYTLNYSSNLSQGISSEDSFTIQ